MTSVPEQWRGELLNRPEIVAAFAGQLRQQLNSYAEFVQGIRRDAEAMWKENPPEGYGSFEAWWRHRWVSSPFAEIQNHLEEAAKLTFKLEARYRRGRHEIPAAKAAAKNPALGTAPRRAPSGSHPAVTDTRPDQRQDFMNLVRGEERSA